MLRSLYRLLPSAVRAKIWMNVAEQVVQNELRRASEEDAALPKVELSLEHITNLRILTDRDVLLGVLPSQSVVAEIGVAEGDFSEHILSIAKPKTLHLIDSWTHDDRYLSSDGFVENRFRKAIESGIVHIHQGFSTTELVKFDDGYFDWVYLDTSHDYASTVDELMICHRKVKRGGIIAGHDYVKGSWVARVRFGVIEAVHEFCIKHAWEMIYLTHESHRHLSFAIREIELR